MTTKLNHAIAVAAALACTTMVSTSANAELVAAICNDISCMGGDDRIVQDNSAGDSSGITGGISFATSAFGYSFLVNTSQSKPLVGSTSAPQLDLTFSATTNSATPSSVFLYVSDSDFTMGGSTVLSLGGTNSGGSGSVTGRAWGGTSNTALQFSDSNLFGTVGAMTGASFSSDVTGSLLPSTNPFSLTAGVAITRSSAGTSTGDLNLQVAAIPEPETYALMLAGLSVMGFVGKRRKDRGSDR